MNWYPPGLCLLELLAPSLFYRSRVLLSSYLMSSPRFTLGCYRHWRWLSLQSIQRRRSNMGTTVYRQLDISPSSTVRCLGPASKKLWAACAESSVTALAKGRCVHVAACARLAGAHFLVFISHFSGTRYYARSWMRNTCATAQALALLVERVLAPAQVCTLTRGKAHNPF